MENQIIYTKLPFCLNLKYLPQVFGSLLGLFLESMLGLLIEHSIGFLLVAISPKGASNSKSICKYKVIINYRALMLYNSNIEVLHLIKPLGMFILLLHEKIDK